MRNVGNGWRDLDEETKAEYQRLADEMTCIRKPAEMLPQQKKAYLRKLHEELKGIVSHELQQHINR